MLLLVLLHTWYAGSHPHQLSLLNQHGDLASFLRFYCFFASPITPQQPPPASFLPSFFFLHLHHSTSLLPLTTTSPPQLGVVAPLVLIIVYTLHVQQLIWIYHCLSVWCSSTFIAALTTRQEYCGGTVHLLLLPSCCMVW